MQLMAITNNIETMQEKACGLCCTKLEGFGVSMGKNEILKDVNIHIHCGELTALIGPNGGGKTTLLKALLGEIPHTGAIKFLDAKEQRSRKPVVGYVPQRLDFDQGAPVSVMDLFAASLSTRPVCFGYARKVRGRASASLARVQADHLLDRRLGDLSGGEMQRVLLALALDPCPDLLLMDEPVSGVDARGRELFYQLVFNLRRQYDLSIILVSHDLDMVSRYADRIVLLNQTVLCTGAPAEVLTNEKLQQAYGQIYWESKVQNHLLPNIVGGVRV
jgi:zinc transport system ATP-binding protein